MDAYINWSRWVADCEACANATVLQAGQVRWVCGRCGTDQPVTWPVDVDSIHAALIVRPAPENRNWRQPETVTDLLEENTAHGVGVRSRSQARRIAHQIGKARNE